jgi:xanthine dehydrogenase accessory factor
VNEWIDRLQRLRQEHAPLMLVTIAAVRGSAPREVGAKMIVTAEQCLGSIGGGQLEYRCSRIAVEHLRGGPSSTRFWRRFPLAADMGQCCGGVVEVLIERVDGGWFDELHQLWSARKHAVMVTASDHKYLVSASGVYAAQESGVLDELVQTAGAMLEEGVCSASSLQLEGRTVLFEPIVDGGMQVAIFGAGHVGSACIAALSGIDCRIRWIDSRRNVFPGNLPAHVTRVDSVNPALEVGAMPPGSFYLVMTHSHPLDYDICHQVLKRDDFAYCGLIGSLSKRRRFEKRMREFDVPAPLVKKLSCPIGLDGMVGKKPGEIAISVAAQLLQVRDAISAARNHGHRHPVLTLVERSGRKK